MRDVPLLEEIVEMFCTGPTAFARLLTVYIAEAHPNDEWYIDTMPNISQHKSIEERLFAAKLFVEQLKGSCLTDSVVVDSFENGVKDLYESWPERLYVIKDGLVVYKGGPGPFQYSPGELREWLLYQRSLAEVITRR